VNVDVATSVWRGWLCVAYLFSDEISVSLFIIYEVYFAKMGSNTEKIYNYILGFV